MEDFKMSSTRHPPYFISNGGLVSKLNAIAVGKKQKHSKTCMAACMNDLLFGFETRPGGTV